jgi:glutamine synthetase adenylyltransferase
MKPSNQNANPPKAVNTLDEIKKLEQKREERRLKMEEMKKEKEERKALNLERGKNVDIDFELMIDKNRFQEKMLQNHISSTAVKVRSLSDAALSLCSKKTHFQEGRARGIDRCHLLRQPKD